MDPGIPLKKQKTQFFVIGIFSFLDGLAFHKNPRHFIVQTCGFVSEIHFITQKCILFIKCSAYVGTHQERGMSSVEYIVLCELCSVTFCHVMRCDVVWWTATQSNSMQCIHILVPLSLYILWHPQTIKPYFLVSWLMQFHAGLAWSRTPSEQLPCGWCILTPVTPGSSPFIRLALGFLCIWFMMFMVYLG